MPRQFKGKMSLVFRLLDCINPIATWNKFWTVKRRRLQQKDYMDSTVSLRKAVAICQNRIDVLTIDNAQLDEEIKKIAQSKQSNRVNVAMGEFRKKKHNEAAISKIQKLKIKIESQIQKISDGWFDISVASQVKEFSIKIDPDTQDSMDSKIEQIEEVNEHNQKFSIDMDLLSDRMGNDSLDESTILDEFVSIYMPEMKVKLPVSDNNNPHAKKETLEPLIPVTDLPAIPLDEIQEEEKEEELEEIEFRELVAG